METVYRAPDRLRTESLYPKRYRSQEKLALRSSGDIREFPILSQGHWQGQKRAGAVRAFFSPDKNPSHIDVGYHDPRKGPNHGKNMTLGVYHSTSQKGAQKTHQAAIKDQQGVRDP